MSEHVDNTEELEEKIEELIKAGCVRITPVLLDKIKNDNEDLYNSIINTIEKQKGKRDFLLIYIHDKDFFMPYSKGYIQKTDVNKIKERLKFWINYQNERSVKVFG